MTPPSPRGKEGKGGWRRAEPACMCRPAAAAVRFGLRASSGQAAPDHATDGPPPPYSEQSQPGKGGRELAACSEHAAAPQLHVLPPLLLGLASVIVVNPLKLFWHFLIISMLFGSFVEFLMNMRERDANFDFSIQK